MIGSVESNDSIDIRDTPVFADNSVHEQEILTVVPSQSKLSDFFTKRTSVTDFNANKRVKAVPLEVALTVDRPLRAPSPIILSPTKVKEIADRKMESLQRMEAKRLARTSTLEYETMSGSWVKVLEGEFTKPYFVRLKEFLQVEWDKSVKIFPPQNSIYSWTTFCPIDQVKVVILGQDPYHNDGQAMGLAFSVPRECRPLPPSLRNIYKELNAEYPETFTAPKHGCLESWAKQGVLILNATLTVKAHEAASHSNRGWEMFTDQVISHLNSQFDNLVFLLWGNHAQKKSSMINKQKHLVLNAAHPSPLSASRGFFGCNHFRLANEFLAGKGRDQIEWHKFD